MTGPAPILESRDAEALLVDLRRRLPAYLPGFEPRPGGPGHALLGIHARLLRALAERINRAPEMSKLAFLDMLGVDLLPAQAARAPVVFESVPTGWDGHAPAGTRLRASTAGEELFFETERGVALVRARLAEVVTVWPGRDGYCDHSADALGHRPFTLWQPLARVPHEIYLKHDSRLSLTGRAQVELEVAVSEPGSEPLEVEWTYWDGEEWAPFLRAGDETAPTFDGTAGLRRSGRVRLTSDCAASAPRSVQGVEGHWLRGDLVPPLPPDDGRRLPEISGLGIRSVLERPVALTAGGCAGGIAPDMAFADGTALDTTKLFHPLGPQAGPESAFYLSCDEAFSRPGARVTICVQRARTAYDAIDAELAKYELGVDKARQIVEGIRDLAKRLAALIAKLTKGPDGPLRANQPFYDPAVVEAWYSDVRTHITDALALASSTGLPARSIHEAASAIQATAIALRVSTHGWPVSAPAVLAEIGAIEAMNAVIAYCGATIVLAAADLAELLAPDPDATRRMAHGALRTTLQKLTGQRNDILSLDRARMVVGVFPLLNPVLFGELMGNWAAVATNVATWPTQTFLPPGLPSFITEARANITAAREALEAALPDAGAVGKALDDLSPVTVAAAANVLPPKLDDPRLVWEYWNGSRWVPRLASSADPTRNLLATGRLAFDAPADWETVEHAGTPARWLRARLVGGSYARVRLVSWADSQTREIKFMAVVEPRPPALDTLRIGYRWESEPAAPERCLTRNDFQWSDETAAARSRGTSLTPFRPTADRTPALYLGFDSALPADVLGLLLDVEEVPGEERGPALEWEAWDGRTWRRLEVEDETKGLAIPGVAHVPGPGFTGPPSCPVAEAAGASVRLLDQRSAARFRPGEEVFLRAGDRGELATVDAVGGDTLVLRAPLDGSFRGGTVAPAGLARFGTPRSWLRARLRDDGEPRRAVLRGVYANAVWAAHRQTVESEVLGGSDGRPGQVLFTLRRPILPGQVVEVRELSGPRADAEAEVFLRELEAVGIDEGECRIERDARGRIAAVWVPWRERPSLLFASPAERVYAVDRERGRLIFGDDARGRIPPAGRDSIRARKYRVGGGVHGNLPAGAIAQVVSGVMAQGVSNPRPSEGGADGERPHDALTRGPLVLRHFHQALTAGDYEALAREASPAVAVARAMPCTGRDGVNAPGHVTVVIVPHSAEPEPMPSLALRRLVRDALAARAPASLGSPPHVVGPAYEQVGCETTVVPADRRAGGPAVTAVTRALERFLHPLTGGPRGQGWPFGRDVHLSDLAALLEGMEEVDAVTELVLLAGGRPRADRVRIPPGRLVSAGRIVVRLSGAPA